MTKKILLVDDEVDMVALVTLRLEAAGYDVVSAYDGEEALEKTKAEKPDLIILDVMLPKLNGYQVCEKIKNDKELSKIPIAMFSALSSKQNIEDAEKLKADAYITKPFEPQELLNTIKNLLGKNC